jgi:hypothetical protein
VIVSPTQRLGAYRPQSSVGRGRLILIRLGGSELTGVGIPCAKYPARTTR